MCRRVGRAQQHAASLARDCQRDRGGERRLADAALAHRHHDAAPRRSKLIDEGVKPGELDRWGLGLADIFVGVGAHQRAQRRNTDQIAGGKRDGLRRERFQERGCRSKRVALALTQRGCHAISVGIVGEDTIEHEPLVGDPERDELAAGPHRLGQRALLRTADQHDRRARGIRERIDRGTVPSALAFKAGKRTKAAGARGIGLYEARPGTRQRKQP